MIIQSDQAKTAWQATERTLDAIVNINGIDYHTTDIASIAYDSGAFTGDTFAIGSTYENNVTITFIHLVEGLKQGQTVTTKIGIKLPDSTFEYSPLGVFVISDDIEMDRNNDATTIKAYDRMALLEGNYVSKLTYPAKVVDVIAEIANLSGVPLNIDDIARLPVLIDVPKAITGQTYRNAIGWIAQFYAGFALFDRDGKLTIRQATDVDYTLDPSQYEQGGLTKNEAPYVIGGIQCQVTTTTTDSAGDSTDNTVTLQAGSSSGSQIEITNDLMDQNRLNQIWDSIKDLNFYPFSLNWFGNPAIEAGDWLALKDTQGNSFNVPNNAYTMTFDGSLSSVSSAEQTSTSQDVYSYTGNLQQKVDSLFGLRSPTGNFIYGPDTISEPTDAKFGDIWYKKNGNDVELWIYQKQSDGTGKWVLDVYQAFSQKVTDQVDTAVSDAKSYTDDLNDSLAPQIATIGSQADSAFDKASQAISSYAQVANQASSAYATASSAASDLATTKSSLANTQSSLAATASMAAKNGSDIASIKTDVSGLRGSFATTSGAVADLQINASQTSLDIANAKGDISSLQNTASQASIDMANAKGDISSLKSRADGFDGEFQNANGSLADLKLRADGFDATVTKVNNLQVGGVNRMVNTALSAVNNTAFLVGTSQPTSGFIRTRDSDGEHYVADASTNERYVRYTGGPSFARLNGLIPGNTYTFHGYYKASSHGLYIREQVGTNGTTWSSDTHTNLSDASDWAYFKHTFTIPANATGYYFSFQLINPVQGDTLDTQLLELENGNVDTAYSVAPEDIDSQFSSVHQDITGLQTSVGQKVDNQTYQTDKSQTATEISQRVTNDSFSSYQTQQADLLANKVESSTYQTMVAQLPNQFAVKATETVASTAASNATVAKNSAALAVSSASAANSSAAAAQSSAALAYSQASAANSLAGGANSSAATAMSSAAAANSSAAIAQSSAATAMSQASQASSAVSSLATYTTAQFSVQNTAIQAKVSQQDFDNLKVGGTNLVIRHNEVSNMMVGMDGTVQAWNGVSLTADYISVTGQKNFVFSKIPSGTETDSYFRYAYYDTNKKLIVRASNQTNSFISNVPDGSAYLRVSYPTASKVKIESGNTKTDWSAAPEDLATEAEVTVMKDDINLRVQKGDLITQLNLEAGTTLLQTGKFIINAATTVISGTSWLDGAVIKNASIGTAQIGTIDASVAHVVNIDANQITANAATFFQTQWQNNYGNRIAINASDIVLTSTTGSNLDIQARKLQFTSSTDSLVINMSTQNWVDINGTTTTAKGLNFSVLGDTTNSYMSFGRYNGSAIMMYAGATMEHGTNIITNDAWNVFTDFVVTNSRFLRFTTSPSTGSYNIVADAGGNSLDFNAVDHFWFNKPIQQNSLLSKKNILGDYPFVAHEELDKMDIKMVNYKDDTEGTKPILTAIIDDVNQVKKYYIPEIMTGHEGVDIYSFASLIALSVKENDLTLADHESRITELENEIKTLKAT
ncbi:hypothetical protein [Oenococcus sicerae]|uniref:hypothetical protein n=1 Tax=Oenococcus sicerae TaxID=2203724 RepID=UPI001FABD5AF|nr:hypothetical protein [Oenococcus sicerae]